MKRGQSDDESSGGVNRPSRHLLANMERILEWSEGGLTSNERADLSEHFQTCAECSEFARRVAVLEEALERGVRQPTLSPEFSFALRTRIESECADFSADPEMFYEVEKSRIEAEFARLSEGLRRQMFRPTQILDLLSYAMVLGLAGYFLLLVWSSQRSRIQEFLFELPRRHDWLALSAIGVILAIGALLLAARGRISRWIQI